MEVAGGWIWRGITAVWGEEEERQRGAVVWGVFFWSSLPPSRWLVDGALFGWTFLTLVQKNTTTSLERARADRFARGRSEYPE